MRHKDLGPWLAGITPRPRVGSVSVLDGYLTARVIGLCHVPPEEMFADLLGLHGDIATVHGEGLAVIMVVVERFNAIGETLSTRPDRLTPIFEHGADGRVRAGPWCMGFLAAMRLRDAA
ncbi:UPF0149 family protein [Paracraurococcus ruber]|nr:UPF0149 family protein [Paracraurococcus ruber]TDG28328.1 UPF0149 family protein [Paracraurococcus ruber]